MSLDDLLLQHIYELTELPRRPQFPFHQMASISRKSPGNERFREQIPSLFLVNRHLFAVFIRICARNIHITIPAWAGLSLLNVPLFRPLQFSILSENVTSLHIFIEFGYMFDIPSFREDSTTVNSYTISIPQMFAQIQRLISEAKCLKAVDFVLHSYEFQYEDDQENNTPGSLSHVLTKIDEVCSPIEVLNPFLELRVNLLRCSPFTRLDLKYSFEKGGYELPMQVDDNWTTSMALHQRWYSRSVNASEDEERFIRCLLGQCVSSDAP